MHTKISCDNPHRYNRWAFAWEYVPREVAAHLDFGCHEGAFLDTLKHKQAGRLVGADVCEQAIERGRRRFPALELIKISHATAIPFAESTFGSATLLDVLEHVDEQLSLLQELHRVLEDAGILIVTVPRKHLFSFLDLGNYKFMFPNLHRWYYCRRYSREAYEQRYVANPDGLVGDVSARKRWHEHFRPDGLRQLLEKAGFDVIDFDGTGFFRRPIFCVRRLLGWIKPLDKALASLERLDARTFESANLFCAARKHSIARGIEQDCRSRQ